jgi:hypothetical protein
MSERKKAMRAVLEYIRPVNTLGLVRQMTGIAELSRPFGDYWRGFEMAAAEGDEITDAELADQLEADQRLDEAEKVLLFEARAEMSLRGLEGIMTGAIEETPP